MSAKPVIPVDGNIPKPDRTKPIVPKKRSYNGFSGGLYSLLETRLTMGTALQAVYWDSETCSGVLVPTKRILLKESRAPMEIDLSIQCQETKNVYQIRLSGVRIGFTQLEEWTQIPFTFTSVREGFIET